MISLNDVQVRVAASEIPADLEMLWQKPSAVQLPYSRPLVAQSGATAVRLEVRGSAGEGPMSEAEQASEIYLASKRYREDSFWTQVRQATADALDEGEPPPSLLAQLRATPVIALIAGALAWSDAKMVGTVSGTGGISCVLYRDATRRRLDIEFPSNGSDPRVLVSTSADDVRMDPAPASSAAFLSRLAWLLSSL